MIDSNNKTSVLVSSQLPRFVREEHETFVKFLEYYYKFLEQDGNQSYVSKNFNKFLDVDLISDDITDDLEDPNHLSREDSSYHIFLQKFYDSYINLIPDKILVDKNLLLKHAKEFYTARGTEKSLRFFMRALFDKEITFYYPKKDILRASDGKWFIEKSLKIADIRVNNVANSIALNNFENHRIVGLTSNAYATVESAETYFDKGKLVTELKLSNIRRDFIDGEKIFTYYTEEGVDKYLTANLFGGIIVSVTVDAGGNNYIEGATVPYESNTGTGAQIVISRTTKGSIKTIGVINGGAGFRINDPILVAGGGGSGATANVFTVIQDGLTHPNSYSLTASTINLEANTPIGNAKYSNLVNSVSDPANNWVSNSMYFWTFANTGPLQTCFVINGGNYYTTLPTVDVVSNTAIRSLGILGRMEIANGGFNYVVGDKIEMINSYDAYGSGGQGRVKQVDSNGTITQVEFVGLPGQFVGGSGYEQSHLPIANVISSNAGAYGANVRVTAVLGDGETLTESLSSVGTIQELKILSGGSGFKSNPSINLKSLGDGTANAFANIVTGIFTYPGRYLNDDGMISSYNFLEDRDYYQNFSYVVKFDESINKYRSFVIDLLHPAGTKLFGEYNFGQNISFANTANIKVKYANTASIIKRLNSFYNINGYDDATYNVNMILTTYMPIKHTSIFVANTANISATYVANGSTISVTSNAHGYNVNSKIYVAFTNSSANIVNGVYIVVAANANQFSIINSSNVVGAKANTAYVYDPIVTITIPNNRYVANNDNVFVEFLTSDTGYSNSVYNVLYADANQVKIINSNVSNSTVNVGTANVYTHFANVFLINHNLSGNTQTYLRFVSGDTANVTNGYQTVYRSQNTNVFTIRSSNTIMSDGTVYVYDDQIYVNKTNHGAANSQSVYLEFTSGDTANTVNAKYIHTVVNANTFMVNTSNILDSNGTVRVYYSNNKYDNISFTRTNHGFSNGDLIYIEFLSPEISNGIFTVYDVYDANTYNIKHTIASYTPNTAPSAQANSWNVTYSGVTVSNNIIAEGVAIAGLYK